MTRPDWIRKLLLQAQHDNANATALARMELSDRLRGAPSTDAIPAHEAWVALQHAQDAFNAKIIEILARMDARERNQEA